MEPVKLGEASYEDPTDGLPSCRDAITPRSHCRVPLGVIAPAPNVGVPGGEAACGAQTLLSWAGRCQGADQRLKYLLKIDLPVLPGQLSRSLSGSEGVGEGEIWGGAPSCRRMDRRWAAACSGGDGRPRRYARQWGSAGKGEIATPCSIVAPRGGKVTPVAGGGRKPSALPHAAFMGSQ
jgi:hypothetical protein